MTHVIFDAESSQRQALLEVADSLALLHDLIPRDSDPLILSSDGTDGLRFFVSELQKKLDYILGSLSSPPIGGQGGEAEPL